MCVALAQIELRVPVDWRCFEKKGGGHTGEPADALFPRTIATTDRKMNMQHATNLLIAAAAAVLPQGTARVHVGRASALPLRWSAESRHRRLRRRRSCGPTLPRVHRGCRRAQAAALAGAPKLSTMPDALAAAAAGAAAPRHLVAATTRLSEGVFLDGARDHTRLRSSDDAGGRTRKMRTSGGVARGGRVALEGLEAILLPELCQVLHPAAVSAHAHADEHAGLSTPMGRCLGWACPQRPAGAPLLVLVLLGCSRSTSPPPKGKWPVLHLSPGARGPAAASHDGCDHVRPLQTRSKNGETDSATLSDGMGTDDDDAVDGAEDSSVQRARALPVVTSVCGLGELRATWLATPCSLISRGPAAWCLGQLDAFGRGGAEAEAMLGVHVDAEAGSVEHPPNMAPLGGCRCSRV